MSIVPIIKVYLKPKKATQTYVTKAVLKWKKGQLLVEFKAKFIQRCFTVLNLNPNVA